MIVSESLKEYETINRKWGNISWDISSDNPTGALEYYNSLVEVREKLVSASKDDEALLDTEIYEDLNTAINTMSESLDTYIGKLYEEEKLNYMAKNGIPSVTEEYKAMESVLVSVAGSSVDLQNRFKELLTSDFADLASDIGNVGNAVSDASAQAQSAIPLFDQLTNSEEALDINFDNLQSLLILHWEKYFQHIREKYSSIYKVQMPVITHHVCRHTFCSNMAKSGMNPKTLQYIMGHFDIGVTLNAYTHL